MTTAAELNELAATLEKALANHDRIVAKRAQEIGDAYGKTYAKAADERIRDSAADLQRATDCIREMRRQMAPLHRVADQHQALVRLIQKAADHGRKLGEGVPPAVLYAAIAESRSASYGTRNPEADQAFAAAKESQ